MSNTVWLLELGDYQKMHWIGIFSTRKRLDIYILRNPLHNTFVYYRSREIIIDELIEEEKW